MPETTRDESPPQARRVAAWSVHLLTASGAVWGMLALVAASGGAFDRALAWMLLAVVVDGIDGPLARALAVRRRAPALDGALLDNLVDYLNYAIVPAFLLHAAGLLPRALSLPGAITICLVSALQFAHVDAKTADHFFRGFPSYWNIAVCYGLLLRPDPRLAAVVVGLLTLLSLTPLQFVYPTRTLARRRLTLALTALWGLCMAWLVWRFPDHDRRLAWGSLSFVVYYALLCRPRRRAR
jgi:phosphatidylcholine synthase